MLYIALDYPKFFSCAFDEILGPIVATIKYHCDMSEDAVVYQVTRLPRNPEDRPLILAITSKTSAQRLIAALAEQEGQLDGYKITAFTHPEFPFMRGMGR